MGNHLTDNKANNNTLTGIALIANGGTVDGTIVDRNRAAGNVNAFGFFADTGSGVNTFKKNNSHLNGGNGFYDTAGPGLLNIYEGNYCNYNVSGGSLPVGLCTPQP